MKSKGKDLNSFIIIIQTELKLSVLLSLKFQCKYISNILRLKKEIELETKNKENATVNNAELERSVRAMEKNVMQLESGNLEADDSEIKQKFDNQRQLNVQLQEQKRWLEHELEQVCQIS